MKKTRPAPAPEEKRDTRIHWVMVEHMCRSCGGRVLGSVAHAGMTPGGNPIARCADCGKSSTSMAGWQDICWCGHEMKFNNHLQRNYMCLPFSILAEKPWLKQGFLSMGCDPDRGGDVGIITRSEYDRLGEVAKAMEGGRKISFQFIDDAAAQSFLDWWTQGFRESGEQSYLTRERAQHKENSLKIKFDYSRAFPAWGYKPEVHGPHRTIQVQHLPPEDGAKKDAP